MKKQSHILFFLIGLSMSLLPSLGHEKGVYPSYNEGINIIPMPQQVVPQQGVFRLTSTTTLAATTPAAKTIAQFFANRINQSTGFRLKVKNHGTITLAIDSKMEGNDEGYLLNVSPDGVKVTGKTAHGLFNGMQSFMQLLPAEIESDTKVKHIDWNVPAVTVKDEPRFGYRGFMLDPCRHFMPVESVKKFIDVLALFKINRMHWHLTDDQGWRIEIKKYPRLTTVASKRIDGEGTEHSGFYTQQQVKDIVKYAADRFITVIPELELPGHEMAAIAAYPELSCRAEPGTPRIIWGVEDVVMCPGKEDMFRFLQDVVDEMVPLFPSEYYHIGGDECPKMSWKNCPSCQKRIVAEGLNGDENHSAEEKLQSYVIRRMEQYLESKGKKIIGWDEILEGGLAPSATVMSWRGESGGIWAASMNHTVIMTPSSNGLYLDYYQGDSKIEPVAIGGYVPLKYTYSYNPVPAKLEEMEKGSYVLGVQGNIWAEYIYNESIREYMTFPRMLAVAEVGWTPTDRKDYDDFIRRINNACVRLDKHHVNYHIPLPEQPGGSCNTIAFTDTVSLTFTTTRPEKMVYTLDGSEPTAQSTEYTRPIVLNQSTTLKIATALPSGRLSAVRTISVEKQRLQPASEVGATLPGLNLQVFDGAYLNVKALEASGMKATSTKVIRETRELLQQSAVTWDMRGVKQYGAIATGFVNIPEDGVYFLSSELEEVWFDGKRVINNSGEVKRFSRHDTSMALSKGLHAIKVVFLGHIIGGWPSNLNDGSIRIRKKGNQRFEVISAEMLSH